MLFLFCLLFRLFRQSLVSAHGCLFCVWRAVARFPWRIRSERGRLSTERLCRLTLPMPSEPHATFASDIGNKWLTGNQKIERNGLQTKQDIDASSVSRSFLPRVHCSAIMGQTANCAPSRKSGCPLSVGGAVSVSQHPFDVRFTVEDFAA